MGVSFCMNLATAEREITTRCIPSTMDLVCIEFKSFGTNLPTPAKAWPLTNDRSELMSGISDRIVYRSHQRLPRSTSVGLDSPEMFYQSSYAFHVAVSRVLCGYASFCSSSGFNRPTDLVNWRACPNERSSVVYTHHNMHLGTSKSRVSGSHSQ